jgi:hypothetical protein
MTPSESLRLQNTPRAIAGLETCPTCDQAIPLERTAEIAGKIAARDRRLASELSAELTERFEEEKTDALEKVRAQAARNEALIRDQVRRDTQVEMRAELEAAAQSSSEVQEGLRAQLTDVQRLNAQLVQDNADDAAALEQLRSEGAQRETRVRAEATQAAEATAQQRINELHEANRAALTELEDTHARARESDRAALAELTQRLSELQQAGDARLAEERARHQQKELASTAQLDAVQARFTEAEEDRLALAARVEELKDSQDSAVKQAVQETREVLEKDKTAALQAEQSKAFEERHKLQQKVLELQRHIEHQSAQELGEGAEIDLFEALKAAFEGDRVKRVPKGTPGADIIHEIVHNDKVCGKIVYDSKNRNVWKAIYATKLREDQIAAHADHAILSTNRFPAGTKQLHLEEGVIIACPARVLALAELLRGHILQYHELRLSNKARASKTEALYGFITSARCTQLLDSVETLINKLLELDVDEQKAHTAMWAKRGKLLKATLKSHGDLCFEFDRIIGTGDGAE